MKKMKIKKISTKENENAAEIGKETVTIAESGTAEAGKGVLTVAKEMKDLTKEEDHTKEDRANENYLAKEDKFIFDFFFFIFLQNQFNTINYKLNFIIIFNAVFMRLPLLASVHQQFPFPYRSLDTSLVVSFLLEFVLHAIVVWTTDICKYSVLCSSFID